MRSAECGLWSAECGIRVEVTAPLAIRTRFEDTRAVSNTVAALTDQLLASYERAGGINHLDGKNLPSKTAIASIAQDLLRLIFPGFFDEHVLHSSELQSQTSTVMASVKARLEAEIHKSLQYAPPAGATGGRDLALLARKWTCEFLGSLPATRDLLQTDIEAAYNGDPAALSREEVIVAYPFVEAIAMQRTAHELYLRQVPLIPRIMTEWAHSRTGMDLHPGATIGPYFFVDHCTGTVIGETSHIGSHVKMYQGVGLVARSLAGGQALRGQKRHPTLEDRVTLYAGATIVGGETVIGEGSTIGANVFLMHSIPPHSLVMQEEVKVKVTKKEKKKPAWGDFQI